MRWFVFEFVTEYMVPVFLTHCIWIEIFGKKMWCFSYEQKQTFLFIELFKVRLVRRSQRPSLVVFGQEALQILQSQKGWQGEMWLLVQFHYRSLGAREGVGWRFGVKV